MNNRSSLILIFLTLLALSAQAGVPDKLSSGAWTYMLRHEATAMSRGASPVDTVLATVETDSYTALDSLRASGVEIVETIGNFAVVRIPLQELDRAASLSGVLNIDFGSEAQPLLDTARRRANVDAVHRGEGLGNRYTGKGVSVGIVDTGLDPLHPSFRDEDGSPRVDMYTYITDGGSIRAMYEESEMAQAQTDKRTATHGTHVAGIAAGSRVDDAIVPLYHYNNDGSYKIESVGEGELPFYGVAPEADIMLAGGSVQTSHLLTSVRSQIRRAEAKGQPAVINLSLGLNTGPHDGTSTFSRALDELGKEAIIVISAGNEGDKKVNVMHTAKTGDVTLRTFLDVKKFKSSDKLSQHTLEFRSDDPDKPLSANIIGYNKTTGNNAFTIPVTVSKDDDLQAGTFYLVSSGNMTVLKRYFECEKLGGVVRTATENGNRIVMIYIDGLYPLESNSDVLFGFEVTAQPGVTITGYTSSGATFTNEGVTGFTDGCADMSISDMATGKNVISVGSYNSSRLFPALEEKAFYGYDEKTMPELVPSDFTSYGLYPDGSTLPHVSAPGALVVSSLSRYYTANGGEKDLYSARIEDPDGGPTAYYRYMQGTSMASPFVTGTIALWLEADPTLTVDDVKEIIRKTSIKDDIYNRPGNAARMGAGRIDALAGLKEVLLRKYGSGISDVSADLSADDALLTFESGILKAFMPGAASVNVRVVAPSGVQVRETSAGGSEATIDLSSLAKGIYIVSATDGHRSVSRKVAVR